MNKLNPIEDNIIEKDQSKQTPTKFGFADIIYS